MRQKMKIWEKWKNRAGMTMVEVIVSFSILMVAFATFSTCLTASSKIWVCVQASKNRMQEFWKNYYLEETQDLKPKDTSEIRLEFVERCGGERFAVTAVRRTFWMDARAFYDVVPEDME
ncbi:MAG: type II secretion system protein [Brotaphodocola sp.]